LQVIETPGHALHHFCVVDEASAGIFTGDTFGLSYRELDSLRGAFVLPTTTPVQFDPDALHASVDRLLGFRPQRMYLTHFGKVEDVERLGADLHADIDAFVAIARAHAEAGEERQQRIADDMTDYLLQRLATHGAPLSPEMAREVLALDITLNAQGLVVWLDRVNTH
jgi:glyoxylase-like metal-dependent hydrolase (beta-lactamase superfamily II)